MRFIPNTKKKKGRQGRSAEVRKRKAWEKEGWTEVKQVDGTTCFQQLITGVNQSFSQCPECMGRNFIEDHSSGDLICGDCGVVVSEGGIAFSENQFVLPRNFSKPYQKVVHFRQRISQLLCKDPELDDEIIQTIFEYIKKNPHLGDSSIFGIKTFSLICRKTQLNPKIASHWLQIRKRLEIAPFVGEISKDLIQRITMRYICISHCFEHSLSKKGNQGQSPLFRNNVLNLNYSIIQLIRIESEADFKRLAKFFPQLISQNQPALNNERWKILLERCQKQYPQFSDPVKGDYYRFDWPYIPLKADDLINHFYHFY
jgi:hypothetical protein